MRDYHCPECGSENIVSFKYLYEQGNLKYGPPKEPEQDGSWVLYLFVCNGLSFFIAKVLHSYNMYFTDDHLYTLSPYFLTAYILGFSSLLFIIWARSFLFKRNGRSTIKVLCFALIDVVRMAAYPTAIFWGFRWLIDYFGWIDGIAVTSDWAWCLYAIFVSFFQGFYITARCDEAKKPGYQDELEKWLKSYQCKRCGKRFYYEE